MNNFLAQIKTNENKKSFQDGVLKFLEKYALKFSEKIIKECTKDRSGAFFYKTANFLMKRFPGQEREILELVRDGTMMSNDLTLREAYKCCSTMFQNDSDLAMPIIFSVKLRAAQKENNIDNVKQIFALSERISVGRPELVEETDNLKKFALRQLCINHPEQGIEMISSMVCDAYPNKNDLFNTYDGLSTILQSSNLPKKAYGTLVGILEECSLSGYNADDNHKRLYDICNTISKRTNQFNSQLVKIKKNISKHNTELQQTEIGSNHKNIILPVNMIKTTRDI